MDVLNPIERIKQELVNKFTEHTTYVGKHIRHEINNHSFKPLNKSLSLKTENVKKGDCFWDRSLEKQRPAVVIAVNHKAGICKYLTLTSTENIHSTHINTNSRFLTDGCYCIGLNITRLEEVTENFICVMEDKKNLNKAIEFNKQFFNR